MGEANWRARHDPTFGKIPKQSSPPPEPESGTRPSHGLRAIGGNWAEIAGVKEGSEKPTRGVVICPPMKVEGSSISVNGSLDPQEARNALLFWDKLVWPDNNFISLGGDSDSDFLASTGVLVRPMFSVSGTVGADIAARLQVLAFEELDRVAPGSWALATGDRSLQWAGLPEGGENSAILELYRAIPVPDVSVPLAEVMEFRSKRNDEALRLRQEIDRLTEQLIGQGGTEADLQISKQQVQEACADLLKAGLSWKFPIRIADLKCSFELNAGQLFSSVAGGAWLGSQVAMPGVTAVIGGALSMLKITADIRRQQILPRSTPYQYVYSFHKDVFNV